MKTYLFACVHNAGRSQMAAAWLNRLADPAQARGLSAGTEPGAHVHPGVLAAMKEVGVDLSAALPRKLTDDLARGSSMLITMGCGEACPLVPGLRREDWPLEDPKGKPVERVRAIRDDIRGRVEELLRREGVAPAIVAAPATAADRAALVGLLQTCQLGTDDLPHALDHFFVARAEGAVVGAIGLEVLGELGLVRSLAVLPARRGQHLAHQLWRLALDRARALGLRELFLLTTTAAGLFARWGFAPVTRDQAPDAIRRTEQYRTGCPESAAFMRLAL